MKSSVTGQPLQRVDGRAKVTGAARYSAEVQIAGVAYGVLVTSACARGRILSIETNDAERALVGQPPGKEAYRKAVALLLAGAQPRRDNAFKIELAKRTAVRALSLAAEAA